MVLHRKKRLAADDSSASSDIAFLLIIYFIVIAGFNINKGFIMNLPAKDSTRLVLKDDLLSFQMDASGSLLYDGAPLDMQSAEKEIRTAIGERPNLALLLVISPAAPWQHVVSFVELAQKLEVDSFSFRMEQQDK